MTKELRVAILGGGRMAQQHATAIRLQPQARFVAVGDPYLSSDEIRERFGTTDMLVRNGPQGDALAEALADAAVVLMRGHGFCAVGETLPVAVFRAIYTETNAALQQRAIALGGTVSYLDEGEARLSEATNRSVVARPWELWKSRWSP